MRRADNQNEYGALLQCAWHRRIGVIRFSYTSDTTLLRDLQILTEHQGRGFGSRCLDLVIEHANSQASEQLVLRVFSENPAIKL